MVPRFSIARTLPQTGRVVRGKLVTHVCRGSYMDRFSDHLGQADREDGVHGVGLVRSGCDRIMCRSELQH